VPVPGRLSQALLEWKTLQEKFKGRRILAPGGIAFAASQFVFAGYSGLRFPTARSTFACGPRAERSGWGRSQPTGCATARRRSLLNHVGKDLREIQELLRHKNIRTTVRYTHVGYEQTRQTAEALSRALE
jgi:integrase